MVLTASTHYLKKKAVAAAIYLQFRIALGQATTPDCINRTHFKLHAWAGRRTARAAAVAEAKKAAEAEEKLRQQHWRVRLPISSGGAAVEVGVLPSHGVRLPKNKLSANGSLHLKYSGGIGWHKDF
eukprot:581331-Pelagomonas_calceolata.AAC.1